jgi:hypothetical protein
VRRAPQPPRIRTVLAAVVLLVLPLLPGVVASGSAAALIRLPGESLLVLLLLALVPWRAVRRGIAVLFGVLVVTGLVLSGIDAGYRSVLDIRFDPIDVQQLGDAAGVVADGIGRPLTIALVVLLAVAAVGTAAMAAWAALRIDAVIRSAPRPGRLTVPALTALWLVAAVAGSQLVAGEPAAASTALGAVTSAADRAGGTLRAKADLPRQVADDPYRSAPADELLTALRGKDVVFAFVESYGRVALTDPAISGGVRSVLADGQTTLAADGYAARSGWLTSPTFGGLSWLAHSTLQTGLWVDKQPLYSSVIRTDRVTLSDAFGRAGWTTVSDVPSDTHPWSFGTSFYHYDTLLDTNDVGYRGPAFGYARIPDAYTWKYFDDRILAPGHTPVMAEVDLVSSHTPWAPLPAPVPWDRIGDGTVYAGQAAGQPSTAEVWSDPARVKQSYGASIEYSLGATFQFLQQTDDRDLVVVLLGDHQPATIVSGSGAGHDVPISVISRDPAVLAAIDGWHWSAGLTPAKSAPVWRMDAFRDRFLAAYGPGGGGGSDGGGGPGGGGGRG